MDRTPGSKTQGVIGAQSSSRCYTSAIRAGPVRRSTRSTQAACLRGMRTSANQGGLQAGICTAEGAGSVGHRPLDEDAPLQEEHADAPNML